MCISMLSVVLAKCHRLNSLSNKNLFSHTPGVWKPKIRVPTGFNSSEAYLLGLQIATLLLPLYVVSLLCTSKSPVSVPLLRRTPGILE